MLGGITLETGASLSLLQSHGESLDSPVSIIFLTTACNYAVKPVRKIAKLSPSFAVSPHLKAALIY